MKTNEKKILYVFATLSNILLLIANVNLVISILRYIFSKDRNFVGHPILFFVISIIIAIIFIELYIKKG